MIKKNIFNAGLLFILFSLFFSCSPLKKATGGVTIRKSEPVILDQSSIRQPLNASEPHIVINRKNPANIVAASILNNIYFSNDSGRSIKHLKISSPYGVFGDPVLLSDKEGRIYFFHLASGQKKGGHWLEGIVMQYSDDGGATWTDGVLIGKNGIKQQDKPWVTWDENSGRIAVAWTEFDRYGSKNPDDKSRILISFSDDRGQTWSPPVKVNDKEGDCLDDDNTVEGAIPLFDDDKIYVVWAYNGKIWLDESADGGKTWGKDRIIARQEAGWNFDIQGIYRANGLPDFFKDKNGNLHVFFGDKKGDRGIIRWVMSSDKGKSWEEQQIPLTADASRFFPETVFDKQSGLIYMLYYNRPDYGELATQIRLAAMTPNGKLIQDLALNEPFTPKEQLFFGDYIGLDVFNGKIAAVWTEIEADKTKVFWEILDILAHNK